MSSGSRRTHRVASLIRAELSRLFIEEISDPRVQEVTITNVELSGDLKTAHVFFDSPSLFDEKKVKEIVRGLERSIPFIRKRIGEKLDLRYVPDFKFEKDMQSSEISRLYQVMDGLQEEAGHKKL